jgi:catechol 2,3-dioxygenase-like lactoylglutathione lyase family enzyme
MHKKIETIKGIADDSQTDLPEDDKQAIPQTTFGLATLNHFGVSVRDLDRSIAFYSALTGEEPAGTGVWSSTRLGNAVGIGSSKATIHWATFRMNNVNIDLVQIKESDLPPAEHKLAKRGTMHACFEVEDMELIFERMQRAGVKFYGPFHRVSFEEDRAKEGVGSAFVYFEGPDGEVLELIEPHGSFVRKERAATKP